MLSGIWAAIQLILRLFGLVDLIREWLATREQAKIEAKNQAQDKAVEDLKHAQTEEEFNRAQEDIVKNSPTTP